MAHKHFCGVGGHHYKCSNSKCICICDVPCEMGDHSDCPIELRSCQKHESGITPAELEAVKESGAVPIQFPIEMPKGFSSRNNDCKKYAGFCLWCGYGYTEYSRQLEAEHFANNCPDAPEELRKNSRRHLSGTTKGKRRCGKDRTSKN
jgi:hypothetical protein